MAVLLDVLYLQDTEGPVRFSPDASLFAVGHTRGQVHRRPLFYRIRVENPSLVKYIIYAVLSRYA